MTRESGFATARSRPAAERRACRRRHRARDRASGARGVSRIARPRGLAVSQRDRARRSCDRLGAERWGREADSGGPAMQPLDRSRPAIAARRPRRPAGARSSSAAGCAIGCSAATSKDIDLEVFGVPADRAADAARSRSAASKTVGESFQVFKVGDIDVSLPRRESKSGRGHRASTSPAIRR